MNIRKVLTFSSGPILSALIGFISTPVLSWIYSPDSIGMYSILVSVLALSIILCSLGMDSAFIREYHDSDDKALLFKHCVYPSVVLFFCFSFIVIILYSNDFYLFSSEHVFIFLTSIFFATVNRFISIGFRMRESAGVYSGYLIFNKTFLLFFLVLFYFIELNDIDSIYFSIFLNQLFLLLFMLVFLNRRERVDGKISKIKIKSYLKYGIPLAVSSLSYWGMASLDKFIISYYLDLEYVGYYSVAQSVGMVFIVIQSIISVLWPPYVYKLNKIDKSKAISSAYMWIDIIITFSILSCLLFLIFLDYIVMFFPEQYHKMTGFVGIIFLSSIIYTLCEMVSIGINIKKKTSLVMFITLLCLFINVTLSILLVDTYKLYGVAISTLISFTIMFVLRYWGSGYLWGCDKNKTIIIKLIFIYTLVVLNDFISTYFLFLLLIIIGTVEAKKILGVIDFGKKTKV
ncbi:oligosaccharide flippase family protein [Vibrio alginolyticus]|uniref:lipopolysaccharide biosynthesis protein n=1 Tax=Vibrio alginolyticus TaxID=663 RepID=UPI001BD69453|nr:oligosaccharide flippase family protein [Vibrio alginolyticus]MBT0057569.1 oligosaccharide flippase family protein [Vibrio alginolyticus]